MRYLIDPTPYASELLRIGRQLYKGFLATDGGSGDFTEVDGRVFQMFNG
jgi:hypothetical protein